MIDRFVKRLDEKRGDLLAEFRAKHPGSYKELVKTLVSVLRDDREPYLWPDPERIHQIDDGEYQGTLVFVIACKGYQPARYWGVGVSYGSCSGCDTLEAIRDYGAGNPSEKQAQEYMQLAINIVQGLKVICQPEWA